jgi:flagellar export protein FliJ
MTRARRFQPVHDIARDAESSCAARVAGMERRLQEAERRQQELRRYRQEYQDSLKERATTGLEVRSLREYQIFLARLSAAISAQEALVEQLQASCKRERADLRAAIARRQSLGKVIERVHIEERKMEDRRYQIEQDERAMQMAQVRP